MAPEGRSSTEERLSGVAGPSDSLAPVEVSPPDRGGDRLELSIEEARRVVDERFEILARRQSVVEPTTREREFDVVDAATANELNHAPAVTRRISRRVWGGVAAVMASLTAAAGAWAHSQGGHPAVPGGSNRPVASAEPFRTNGDQAPKAMVATAEAKADVPTTAPKPPTSSTTVAAAEKAAVEAAPTPTPVSPELRAKLANEYYRLGQIEDLKEVNRISSAHGDVVMVSVEGATPTVSAKELKVLIDYFDQATAHPVADTYTITLEDQTKLTIPYTSDYSKVSTRVFVFASQGYDLRKISPSSFEGGDGFTRYRPDSPSDTGVTILRSSKAGKATDWLFAAQEVCQNTLRVKLDQAFVDQVKHDRPNLAKLNFDNIGVNNVDTQLYNTGLALQDIKCASDAWVFSAIRAGEDYTTYLAQVSAMVHPLFKFDILPYMSVTPAEYASMRAYYNKITK